MEEIYIKQISNKDLLDKYAANLKITPFRMTRDKHLLEHVLRDEIYSRMKPRKKVKLKIKHEK